MHALALLLCGFGFGAALSLLLPGHCSCDDSDEWDGDTGDWTDV